MNVLDARTPAKEKTNIILKYVMAFGYNTDCAKPIRWWFFLFKKKRKEAKDQIWKNSNKEKKKTWALFLILLWLLENWSCL